MLGWWTWNQKSFPLQRTFQTETWSSRVLRWCIFPPCYEASLVSNDVRIKYDVDGRDTVKKSCITSCIPHLGYCAGMSTHDLDVGSKKGRFRGEAGRNVIYYWRHAAHTSDLWKKKQWFIPVTQVFYQWSQYGGACFVFFSLQNCHPFIENIECLNTKLKWKSCHRLAGA